MGRAEGKAGEGGGGRKVGRGIDSTGTDIDSASGFSRMARRRDSTSAAWSRERGRMWADRTARCSRSFAQRQTCPAGVTDVALRTEAA